MKAFNRRKGQYTVEYILLVSIVLSFAIYILVSKNAPYPGQLNAAYLTAMDDASSSTQRLFTALNNKIP